MAETFSRFTNKYWCSCRRWWWLFSLWLSISRHFDCDFFSRHFSIDVKHDVFSRCKISPLDFFLAMIISAADDADVFRCRGRRLFFFRRCFFVVSLISFFFWCRFFCKDWLMKYFRRGEDERWLSADWWCGFLFVREAWCHFSSFLRRSFSTPADYFRRLIISFLFWFRLFQNIFTMPPPMMCRLRPWVADEISTLRADYLMLDVMYVMCRHFDADYWYADYFFSLPKYASW